MQKLAVLLPTQAGSLAAGNAMPGTVKKEEEGRTDLEADEKDEGLALRSALHLAVPRQAAEQGRCMPTPGATVESLSVGLLSRAAENSPSTRALTRAAGHMSTAGPEDVQHSSVKSRKRISTVMLLQPEIVTAAALAADGAGATAVDESSDSKLAQPARKRIKHEAAGGTSSMNGRLAVQSTSPLPSRGHSQTNVCSTKDTIVISDSEEEEGQPTATPSSKPIPTPHANAAPTHARTKGGAPTPPPLRTPTGKTTAAKSSPEAPNTGSASDPIEIDISSDDDQVPAPTQDQPGSAQDQPGSAQYQPGSAQHQPGSAPVHLKAEQNELDMTSNRRRSPQGKLGSTLASPNDLYVSLSDHSNTPLNTPSTIGGRNTVQGSHMPLARFAKGSHPPLSDSVKGSPASFRGIKAATPAPRQAPLSNHMKGSTGPFSLTKKSMPAPLRGLPVPAPDALLESVRSAARSSALLSVPRRGRVIFAKSSPLHAMAPLGKLLSFGFCRCKCQL